MAEDNLEGSYIVSTSNHSETENIAVIEDGLEKSNKWTHVAVMCLLEILWEEYEKAKFTVTPRREIFENAAREMQKNGYNYTLFDVRKKYANMNCTYRKLKRNVGKGKNAERLTWPYFEIFKEIRQKDISCRIPTQMSCSAPEKRKDDKDWKLPSEQSSPTDESYPSLKRAKTLPKNLSVPAGGLSVSDTDDLSAFSSQWEQKRVALEDFKMHLIETLFKDIKQQRCDAEEDAFAQLQMRYTKNRHLKEIVSEMSHLRTEVRKELSSLSESINDLISAIRNSSG